MNRYAISPPAGTFDRILSDCSALRAAEAHFRTAMARRGYQEVSSPAIEDYDVFLQAKSPLKQEDLFKLIDENGRILVLRPDSTIPLARIAAGKLAGSPPPYRMFYIQDVLRAHTGNGHPREIRQAGAELIGANGPIADLDLLTSGCDALEAFGATRYSLELGHAGIYRELMEELGAPEDIREEIRRCIESKSFAALSQLLAPYRENSAYKALLAMPKLFGGREVLEQAGSLTKNPAVHTCLAYLELIFLSMSQAGYGEHLTIDLGLVHEMGYYTGILFRGFLAGKGGTLLSGGRYDSLCGRFGREMPAVGFAVDLGELLQPQEAEEHPPNLLIFSGAKQFAKALAIIREGREPTEICLSETLPEALDQAQQRGIARVLDISGKTNWLYERDKVWTKIKSDWR